MHLQALLILILVLAAAFFVVAWLRGKFTAPEPQPAGAWNVFLFKGPESGDSFAHDVFPYDQQEADDLVNCGADQFEDEAASYASFACYMNLDKIDGNSQIVVTSTHSPKIFTFKPDFEEGFMIGVELDERPSTSPYIDTSKMAA